MLKNIKQYLLVYTYAVYYRVNGDVKVDGSQKKSFITESKEKLSEIKQEVVMKAHEMTGRLSLETKMDYLTKLTEILLILIPFFLIDILIVIVAIDIITPLTIVNFIAIALVILRIMDYFSLNHFIMRKNRSDKNQEKESQEQKKRALFDEANKIDLNNFMANEV